MPAYSQDYIKRMIEQIGEAWAEVVALLKQDDPARAIERLDQAYRDLVHLDRDLVHKTSEDFLILATTVGKVGDVDRSLALADLLRIEAEIHEHQDEPELRAACLFKAINVLVEASLRLSHASSQEHVERIDQLATDIKGLEAAPATHWRLFRYFESRSQFDKAEDALYELLDADPDVYADHGIDFYQRLLKQPDHVLEQGGLPRAEVQDGLEQLLDSPA